MGELSRCMDFWCWNDFGNGHRRTGTRAEKGGYGVSAFRFVPTQLCIRGLPPVLVASFHIAQTYLVVLPNRTLEQNLARCETHPVWLDFQITGSSGTSIFGKCHDCSPHLNHIHSLSITLCVTLPLPCRAARTMVLRDCHYTSNTVGWLTTS